MIESEAGESLKHRQQRRTVQLPCTAILQTSTAIYQLSYSQLALVAGPTVPSPSPLETEGGVRFGCWVSVGMGMGFGERLLCSGLPVSWDSSGLAASNSAGTGTQGRGHTHTRHYTPAAEAASLEHHQDTTRNKNCGERLRRMELLPQTQDVSRRIWLPIDV